MRSLLPLVLLLSPAALIAQEDVPKRKQLLSNKMFDGGEKALAAAREMASWDSYESAAAHVKAWVESDRRDRERIKALGEAALTEEGLRKAMEWERQYREVLSLGIGSYVDPAAVRHLLAQMRISTSESLRETIASASWRYGSSMSLESVRTALREERSPLVLRSLLESAGRLASEAASREIVALLVHAHRKVRRAAIAAVRRLDLTDAVPALIAQLEVDGLLASEINEALVILTGENKRGSPSAWAVWWTESRTAFLASPPPLEERLAAADRASREVRTSVEFFGIPVLSRRIVFVIDRSESMAGSKLGEAVKEITDVLDRLPSEARFNIVAFNAEAIEFQGRMAEARADMREQARAWLGGLEPEGGTNLWGALQRGLSLASPAPDKVAADSIYLVSDGRPNSSATAWVLAKVRERNPEAKVVIHTVCVGGDADHEFLRRLAEENEGHHKDR